MLFLNGSNLKKSYLGDKIFSKVTSAILETAITKFAFEYNPSTADVH